MNIEPSSPHEAGLEGLPLDASVQPQIERGLAVHSDMLGHRCLADYTYRNLYLFRRVHAYRFFPGELPCVGGVAYDGTRFLLPLFDLATIAAAKLQRLLGNDRVFFPIAEQVIGQMDMRQFWSHVSPDDSDYLFDARHMSDLSGPGLGSKRHAIERLLRAHTIETRQLGDNEVAAARTVLDEWCRDKRMPATEADVVPCQEALSASGLDRMAGYIYYADGRPAGFTMGESLGSGTFVFRFAKGLAAFEGIYPYMFRDYCARNRDTIRWINFEQDLGNAGFRRSKRSYRPVAMLSKYRVRPL